MDFETQKFCPSRAMFEPDTHPGPTKWGNHGSMESEEPVFSWWMGSGEHQVPAASTRKYFRNWALSFWNCNHAIYEFNLKIAEMLSQKYFEYV